MITVFYDDRCGLCRKEIRYYQSKALPNTIDWVDITDNPDKVRAAGLTFDEAMRRFYVVDDNQQRFCGVDGFIQIWKVLPNFRFLAVFFKLPIIYSMSRLAYAFFSWFRYRYHGYHHCRIDHTT